MKSRTSFWKARSSGLNSMSIDDSPLGKAALIFVTHVYVNGKLLLATFIAVNKDRVRRTSRLVQSRSPSHDGKNTWGMTNDQRQAPGAFRAAVRGDRRSGGFSVPSAARSVVVRASGRAQGSAEHTSEHQSLLRLPYAISCLNN